MSVMAASHIHSDVGTITATLAAGTSSAEISLGPNTIWAFTTDGDIFFKVGVTGMTAPTTANFALWSKSYYTLIMGRGLTHIRIFNNTAGNVNYYLHPLVMK